jgi:hypothetical protein
MELARFDEPWMEPPDKALCIGLARWAIGVGG